MTDEGQSWAARIDAANRHAVERMISSRPRWVDVLPARELRPKWGEREIAHSGPPITWERMSGAQKGAVLCGILFEEWATDEAGARALAASGEITFGPNHERGGVGPMAGVVTPNMPVFVVEEPTGGDRVYAALEEPRMNFGAFDKEAVELRRFWRDTLAPTLGKAVRAMGGLDLQPIIARALHRGDEMHNRPAAATSLFLIQVCLGMMEAGIDKETMQRVTRFIDADEIFFLSLSMAASKSAADRARDIEHSTVVTALARNGTDFGIQVSGLGGQWFTAAAPVAEGLFLPGYGANDAGADMGDSAITETVGLGGFVLPAAPAIFEMLGCRASDAISKAKQMKDIAVGRHPQLTLPLFDFESAPIGIDVRKVVDTRISPLIDTAIAHREPGHPIIGAGLTRPPLACFDAALTAFANERGLS